MLILATGGSGQVATQLAQIFDGGGAQFKVIGKSELDISIAESVSRALDRYNPRFLVNAAAYTAVDLAEDYKTDAFLLP